VAIADFVVIGIVIVAGLVAFSLGVVRVALGLGGWVGAGLATLYGFAHVRPIAHRWIESALFADIAGGAALFVVSLIVLTLIGHAIAERVRDSSFGALDRSLGMVTGLVLGAVVVCVGFIVMERLMELPGDPAKRPDWIRTAKSAPIVEWGATQLILLLPSEWRGDQASVAPDREGSARAAWKAAERLAVPKAEGGAAKKKSGYNTAERKEMDRLMRTRQQAR
jgi:membrane protein required for colicin V production